MPVPSIAEGTYRVKADTKQAEAANKNLAKSLSVLRGGAIAAGVAIAAIGIQGANSALNAEKGLREVNTLLGFGAEGFKQLQQDTLDFQVEVKRTSGEVIPALYQAISAGVPRENVFEFLNVASDLAEAGVTTLESSTDLLTTAVNAYANQNLTATRAADVLFASVRAGKTTIEEISASLANLAPTAAASGVSFEQMSAGFTTLTLTGVPTAQAMIQLRGLMQAITSPAEGAKEAFKEYGIEVNQARLQQEGFLPIVNDMLRVTGGEADKLKELLPSIHSRNAALIIGSKNGEAFNRVLQGVTNSEGEATKAANEMDKSLREKLDEAFALINTSMEIMAFEVIPPLAEAMTRLTEKFIEDIMPAIRRDFIPAAKEISTVLLPALGTAFKVLATIAGDMFARISNVWNAWKSLFEGDFKAFGENLVRVWAAPLTTMKSLLETFGVNFDDIWVGIQRMAQRAINGVISGIEKFANSFAAVYNNIRPILAWLNPFGGGGPELDFTGAFGRAGFADNLSTSGERAAAWESHWRGLFPGFSLTPPGGSGGGITGSGGDGGGGGGGNTPVTINAGTIVSPTGQEFSDLITNAVGGTRALPALGTGTFGGCV